ncbi:hypothetical protein I8I70_000037 [Escherichia coli]|nr:hypothetical protein VEE32_15360 [Escherichia coli]
MTIAERLRQEGHQIGWQEGKLEGLHEQAIKIALRMLEQGFDRDQVLAATQLSEADLAANNHQLTQAHSRSPWAFDINNYLLCVAHFCLI